MNPSDAFGHDYAGARRLFLEAAEEAGAETTPLECPARGPEGQPLYADLAWIGPEVPRAALLTMSGTHGVEGIAGSAIQATALRSGLHRELAPDTALVMLHALTPHGFAWLRRCNEDGVDVCRNFVDFTAPRPGSAFFDEYIDDLVPRAWSGPERESADARLFAWAGRHGVERFAAEVARGQYDYDIAPFFGGRAPTWSNAILRAVLASRLSSVSDLVVIDYHTGLGERGTGQLLGFDHPSDPGQRLAGELWGEDHVPLASEASVAYETLGDIAVPFAEMFPHARVLTAAYEFGTVDPLSVLQALRGDHWLHAYGDPTGPEAAEIKDAIRSAFYCETPDWHRSVCEQARHAERRALAALSE